MEPQSQPNPIFRPYLASTISLLVIGWGAAIFSILVLAPTLWARWLLFFGGTLGLTGVGLPVMWFLNLRFKSNPPAGAGVIVRQAIWVGVYGAVLIWLQQVRLVTLWSVLGLAAGLIAIEYLIRMREKVRWQPKPIPEEAPQVEELPASPSKE